VTAVVLALGLWLVPWLAAGLVACGLVDVLRHRRPRYELFEKYFTGNGLLTWLLSPVNLLADLFAGSRRGVWTLQDLPAGHRAEVERCVQAFLANEAAIKAHVEPRLADRGRVMLTFRWFDHREPTELRIPEFDQPFRYVKTIAISVFNRRERTSWHFGPLRLSLRVLYNLAPSAGREAFIEVDDVVHYWSDDPLFIFDDTRFHRSTNAVDAPRYCLFMDLVRPSPLHGVLSAGLTGFSSATRSVSKLFYKNWVPIR
jgi:beta-hydroxylase